MKSDNFFMEMNITKTCYCVDQEQENNMCQGKTY